MGNAEFSSFDSLYEIDPGLNFDSMIDSYLFMTATEPSSLNTTPWTSRYRALEPSMKATIFQQPTDSYRSVTNLQMDKPNPLAKKKKYKPRDRKVRPVPTNFPNPAAQQFKPIPLSTPLQFPTHPIEYQQLQYSSRVTLERLESMLARIESGILTPEETNLLAFVVVSREKAFAFDHSEKGMFSREFYPDYEIPTIEHVPWQKPPIRIPNAIIKEVKQEIRDQEKSGKFEPTTSSYRSALFAVAKKKGVRLVINLEPLNEVTIQDASLPPNINEFAEWFLGYAMYGLLDLFSGFDARWVAEKSRPLQAFHTPIGPRQQTTLVQGYTNSVQEFQRCTKHALLPVADIADNFIDDCGLIGPNTRYGERSVPENPGIRQFVWEYIRNLDRVLAAMIQAGITASGPKAVLAATKLRIVGSVVSLEGWVIEPSVVQRILDWPLLTSVTDIRSFLGTAGVGRK